MGRSSTWADAEGRLKPAGKLKLAPQVAARKPGGEQVEERQQQRDPKTPANLFRIAPHFLEPGGKLVERLLIDGMATVPSALENPDGFGERRCYFRRCASPAR